MLRQLADRWIAEAGEFPSNYLVYDLETTGFRKESDLIVELGHCVVKDNVAEYYHSQVLGWDQMPDDIEHEWLQYKIQQCADHMASAGRQSHMTWERMCEEGEDPIEALDSYYELLMSAQEQGVFIAGHNFLGFDNARFAHACDEWLGKKFEILNPNRVIDTAAIEKAVQLDLAPFPEETLVDFFRRVTSRSAKGTKHNLDQHCVKKYRLEEKYDMNPADAHTAGFDSVLVHWLINEYKEQADGLRRDHVLRRKRRKAKR